MQSFLNFCTFTESKPPPVQADTVLLRSNMFQPGRTFQMYTAHLAKATILLIQPTDWMCPDIKSVMRGLANAQDFLQIRKLPLFGWPNPANPGDETDIRIRTRSLPLLPVSATGPSEPLQIRKASLHGRKSDFTPTHTPHTLLHTGL